MSSDIVQVDKDISESELLDELAALALSERKPGGVTVRELMERVGSESRARRILRSKEKRGEIYWELAVVDGHPAKVWYRKCDKLTEVLSHVGK